jgi:hypothetical protein
MDRQPRAAKNQWPAEVEGEAGGICPAAVLGWAGEAAVLDGVGAAAGAGAVAAGAAAGGVPAPDDGGLPPLSDEFWQPPRASPMHAIAIPRVVRFM